jgi:undecaprenyl-diphosphatase
MYFLFTQLSFLQKLEQWDHWLFIQINNHQSNPFFDSIMPYLRNSFYWAPLYLFLLMFATLNFKGRGWWWVLLFLCTVSLTDITSSRIIKEAVERLRPCQDPDFFENIRLLVNQCSGGYSFTSSHAANHFGMAAFFFITSRQLIKNWALLAFFWAAAISYAQVYVGVHYPFDVLGGALVGVFFGLVMGVFFNKRFGIAIFGK